MQRILILKADLICAEALRAAAERLFPSAAIILVSRIERAQAVLDVMDFDLLVTGLDLPDGDALDFIFDRVKSLRRARRILVVTQHHGQHVLETLREWQVDGVFDPSSEGPRSFEHALRTVAGGRRYWSRRLTDHVAAAVANGRTFTHVLSPAEQAMLAHLGDGTDNKTASRELGREPDTIQTIRGSLHRKLKLHDKGELTRFAACNGFVRFKREGVVRPGYAKLRATYDAQSRARGSKRGRAGNSAAAA